MEPPPEPAQVQLQGPEPETPDAVPELQSPDAGAEATVVPFAEPQEPLTTVAVFDAEQLAVEPPPEPVHDQLHGPEPEKEATVPAVHRPAEPEEREGAVVPLTEPQVPATGVAQVTEPLVAAL